MLLLLCGGRRFHLAEHLKKNEILISSQSISLTQYPNTIRYSLWQSALADVHEKGEPRRFSIHLEGLGSTGPVNLRISRDTYFQSGEYFLCVDMSGISESSVVDGVLAFLGLTADTSANGAKRLPRSAFIAHRFDAEGEQTADRLRWFLELLAFDVKTGRGFSPQSVSDKVRKRIEAQAIVFVVLTSGDDATWLTQESILSCGRTSQYLYCVTLTSTINQASLGIASTSPSHRRRSASAFVAVLEGLRELGYLTFEQ